MKVESINQSQNFRGIKLSKSQFRASRGIVQAVQCMGARCPGYKVYFGNYKDIAKQASICNYIREKYHFDQNEFGVVYFPVTNDTYMISNKMYEQKLLDYVKLIDKKAFINLFV